MDIRSYVCFMLSRRLMRQPEKRTIDFGAYRDWRHASLSKSFAAFDSSCLMGKDVLDFGCGDGELSFFLAKEKRPRRIVGVDISAEAIDRARSTLRGTKIPDGTRIEFAVGSTDALPFPDQSFDALLAFDCFEHVMSPDLILRDWYRVLRPGGQCCIEWFPYKGPWGPHMESLIPIPWAHVLFGERAMFRAAESIYDLPEFVPRHWDLDESGKKKPNKWQAWSSFEEQGYINKLTMNEFRRLAQDAGFDIDHIALRSFGGSVIRKSVGNILMHLPVIGEYFVMFALIKLRRP